MIYRVFIEGREIDLNPNTVIAITLQATGIGSGDPVSRLTSFTNQITVPPTSRNVSVFEFSNNVQSSSTFPYNAKTFRILCNGIEVSSGTVKITNAIDNSFNLNFFGLFKGLSIALGNSVLSDLDFGDSPITWDDAYWDTRRNATTYFCCPVINYGQINVLDAHSSIGFFYLPSIAYKDIITHIFDNHGYTPFGDFYDNDQFFNNMILAYSRKSFPFLVGSTFKANEILSEEIKQIDFLKDFLVKFNLQLRFTGNTVEILPETDVFSSATSVKWTLKRANKRQIITHYWDSWSMQNLFLYDPKDNISELWTNPPENNDGSIDIANPNISSSRDVYKSLTACHQAIPGVGYGFVTYDIGGPSTQRILCATMNVWDTVPASYSFDNEPKPMLCLLRDPDTFTPSNGAPNLVEGTIRYNGIDRADYKVAYFATPGDASNYWSPEMDNLRWKNHFGASKGLLDLYYPTTENILQTAKKVTNFYYLTELDIVSLDLLTPVFDTDTKYIISKVYDFVPGRVTKVDLLKI